MSTALAVNGTFVLKWEHYGLKGDILDYWGTPIFWLIIRLYHIK